MTKTKPIVPSEEFEQVQFVNWLTMHDYKFTSIPNAIPSQALRLKHGRTGLRPGLPDMLIILKKSSLLWVELKRSKPASSKVSSQQKIWLQELAKCGSHAKVCYGADEAIALVKELDQ